MSLNESELNELPELGTRKTVRTIYVAVGKDGNKCQIFADNDADALANFEHFMEIEAPNDDYILNRYDTEIQGWCICS